MAPAATSMTNEANREEALKCLHLSRQHWQSNQKAAALKYATKSVSLYETVDGRVWLEKIKVEYNGEEEEAGAPPATEAKKVKEEPRKTSPTGSGSSQSEASKASFTAEQVAEVKKFSKINKSDYYAVLGITKSASDVDIKKAYRKVHNVSSLVIPHISPS